MAVTRQNEYECVARRPRKRASDTPTNTRRSHSETPTIHAAMTHIDTRQRQSHTRSPPASACQGVVDLRAIPKRDAPCAMADGEEKPPSARDSQGATARSHPAEAEFAGLLEAGGGWRRKLPRNTSLLITICVRGCDERLGAGMVFRYWVCEITIYYFSSTPVLLFTYTTTSSPQYC